MALLIDGYNLLHVTGLFGRGAATFEASRGALLGFLAAAIEANSRRQTTVVFDAAHAPPGIPDQYTVQEIRVHFARDYESADELLEVLIASHPTPRKLTVVSSDHRVQRAAKKRRALAVDSHVWYQEVAEQLKQRRGDARELPDVKPDVPLTKGEVAVWVRLFGPVKMTLDSDATESLAPPPPTRPAVKRKTPPRIKKPVASRRSDKEPAAAPRVRAKKPAAPRVRRKTGKPPDHGFGDISNPFPPGYGKDAE